MLIHLALIRSASGRLSMGWEAGREAERLVEAAHAREDDLRAIAQVPLAEIEYARNDLPGARRRLDFAIPVMAAGEGWVDVFARAFEVRIRIALVEEGLAAAFGFLDRGYEIAAARNLWRLRWSLDALRHEAMCRTHLLAEDDEIDRGLAAAVAAGATPQGRRLTWRELSAGRLTLARAALFANKAPAALTLLDDAVEQGEALGAYRFVVPALILRAIARERCGDPKGGFDAFLRAVAIAAPQGVLRPFIDEGERIVLVGATGGATLRHRIADPGEHRIRRDDSFGRLSSRPRARQGAAGPVERARAGDPRPAQSRPRQQGDRSLDRRHRADSEISPQEPLWQARRQ